MTSGHPPPPHLPSRRLIVVGVGVDGAEVARLDLGHGDDPAALLAAQGWQVRRAREVRSDPVDKHVLTISFEVEPTLVVEPNPVEPNGIGPPATAVPPRRDEDLVTAEGEIPQRYQRVAAYAFVTSARGVLMTQFSDRTNASGRWGLPGGGLEADEAPGRAVVREVWEETGQVIEVNDLALVHARRWVGRAPAGRLEDFHAVQIIYRGSCHTPTEPVVHDVGGTTAAAAWVPPTDLGRLGMTDSWRSLVSAVVMAPDEADRPERHEQDTDSDDRARPQR